MCVCFDRNRRRARPLSLGVTHTKATKQKRCRRISYTQVAAPSHAASSFACLGSRHLMFHKRNPTLLLVTSLYSSCLSNKRSLMIEMAGRQRTRSSSIKSIPLRPDAEVGIKSHNNNSVRTTRLSASQRICFRARLLPVCSSLDASLRVSFLSHSTCSR